MSIFDVYGLRICPLPLSKLETVMSKIGDLKAAEQRDAATCVLCGAPMPPGEEMFRYHGYSGPCPRPRLPDVANRAAGSGSPPAKEPAA